MVMVVVFLFGLDWSIIFHSSCNSELDIALMNLWIIPYMRWAQLFSYERRSRQRYKPGIVEKVKPGPGELHVQASNGLPRPLEFGEVGR